MTQATLTKTTKSSGMDAYKLWNKGEFIDKFVDTIHTRFKNFAMWKMKIKHFKAHYFNNELQSDIKVMHNINSFDNTFKRLHGKIMNSAFFDIKLSFEKKAYMDKEIEHMQTNKKLIETFDDKAVEKILHFIMLKNKMDVHEAIGLLRERPHCNKNFGKLVGPKSKTFENKKKSDNKSRTTIGLYKKNGISVAYQTIYRIYLYYIRKVRKAMVTLKIHKQKNIKPAIRVGLTS